MKHGYWYLLLILLVGLTVRLYRINEPLADWHSWRQVDTTGVTREFIKDGIDILRPRYMDLSSIPSGKDNPLGWRMVEFPFVNAVSAATYNFAKANGANVSLTVLERLISISFSLGSIIFLYLIVKWVSGESLGLLSAFIFAILPFNIYFSRVTLPEPKLVFFSLAASYFFLRFISSGSIISWTFGVLMAALATLIKPTWLIIFGPALVLSAIAYKKKQILTVRWGFVIILGTILALLPFVLWRLWIGQFPQGIPASDWLFNAGGIRFRPAWFRWLFADRIGRLILGYWGLIPFGIGLIIKPAKKENWFFHCWLFGGLAYLSLLASGNVTHDYYQTILIPIFAVFVAKGIKALLHPPALFSRAASLSLASCSLLFALAFSWFHIRDYFNINHPEIIEAGKAADQILPATAKVITPYGGDTAFLFATNRSGWPLGGAIEDKLSKGATHYISVNFDDETRDLMERCQVMLKADKYVILDIRQCRSN